MKINLIGIPLIMMALVTACTKKTSPEPEPTPISYNYTIFTYFGNTSAFYTNIENNVTMTWDTVYSDSVIVKIDSAKDRILFIANEHNPLGVYPQMEYPFGISSNYFRKNFIQNHYQSFYFEGDSLKSYYFHLQEGSGVSYQKEIKFSGYLKK